MAEFLVQMNIYFPPDMPLETIRSHLEAESTAVQSYIREGSLIRCWRSWGSHEGSHGHLSLWRAEGKEYISRACRSFPLVTGGYTDYGDISSITALLHNPNDPGPSGYHPPLPSVPFPLTYQNLRRHLDANGTPSTNGHGEGNTAVIPSDYPEVISVHEHPQSGRPFELHFMVGDVKIAEFGPPDLSQSGDVGPGYVDFLMEWAGKPVHYEQWKNLILADNSMLYPDYGSAISGRRQRQQHGIFRDRNISTIIK